VIAGATTWVVTALAGLLPMLAIAVLVSPSLHGTAASAGTARTVGAAAILAVSLLFLARVIVADVLTSAGGRSTPSFACQAGPQHGRTYVEDTHRMAETHCKVSGQRRGCRGQMEGRRRITVRHMHSEAQPR
jgi:hypothetical protein